MGCCPYSNVMCLSSSDKFLLRRPENGVQTKKQHPREAEKALVYKLWGLDFSPI